MATQDDLNRLEEALFSGKRRVKYRDREVEYTSVAEMKAARDLLLSLLSPTRFTIKVSNPDFSKGL